MTVSGLHGVVLDGGPLIGAMYRDDRHHDESVRGLTMLEAAHIRLVVPLPVVFEVYKRLAYDVGTVFARRALTYIHESCTVIYVDPDDLENLREIVTSMPGWRGSLEDAAIALVGLRRSAPVWTYNYRDLRAFTELQFWTPG